MEEFSPEYSSHSSGDDYILPTTSFQPLFPQSRSTEELAKKREERSEEERAPIKTKTGVEKRLPMKGAVPSSKKEKKKAKKKDGTYKTYISRVLKRVHPDAQISSEAMNIMDLFINDMFEKLTFESSQLIRHNEKMTITCREIQASVRLVLPEELAKYAIAEGMQAVAKFYTP